MKTQKKKQWWIWLFVIAYIAFIFHNSMMVAEASDQMSMGIASKILAFLQTHGITIDFYKFHYYLRKFAHFTEFAGLGFFVGLAAYLAPFLRSSFLNFLLFLVAIPASDEFIQRFVDGRSSQVSDMYIDGVGYLFGGLCSLILISLCYFLFRKKEKQPVSLD